MNIERFRELADVGNISAWTPPCRNEWLGIDNADPALANGHASFLNDVEGYSLPMIADAIEATWPEVKVQE